MKNNDYRTLNECIEHFSSVLKSKGYNVVDGKDVEIKLPNGEVEYIGICRNKKLFSITDEEFIDEFEKYIERLVKTFNPIERPTPLNNVQTSDVLLFIAYTI